MIKQNVLFFIIKCESLEECFIFQQDGAPYTDTSITSEVQ